MRRRIAEKGGVTLATPFAACMAVAASCGAMAACGGNSRAGASTASLAATSTTASVARPPEAAMRDCQTLDAQLNQLLNEIDFDYAHRYPKSTFERLARESARAVDEALRELGADHLLSARLARSLRGRARAFSGLEVSIPRETPEPGRLGSVSHEAYAVFTYTWLGEEGTCPSL